MQTNQIENSIKFTFVILYRHADMRRFANLKKVLEWAGSFTESEILIVEQDTHSKIGHLNLLPARHIFTKSDMPFNRSWGFNVGAKYAKSDVLVLTDCDLIMDPYKFIEALNLITQYECVSPYSSVVDLTMDESHQGLPQILNINRPGRGETDNQKINICGGMTIFRKDAYLKIAGYNEDFIGWGGEDDFQAIKVENFLAWHELSGRCYHLFHERTAPDVKWYQRNLQLLQKLKALGKEELTKVINQTAGKIGMSNKYDNF
jgi:predicted glycosyltransferase involved in capsule biosynthesis